MRRGLIVIFAVERAASFVPECFLSLVLYSLRRGIFSYSGDSTLYSD